MWVARDRRGDIRLYRDKPLSCMATGEFYVEHGGSIKLPKSWCQRVTFSNSPQKVTGLTLKRLVYSAANEL
jgi:hypothetical protein